MMSIQIPQAKTGFTLAQNGDKFGDIVRTRNLDFSKDGYLSLARKALVLFSGFDSTDFGEPIAITNDDANYYIITNTGFYLYVVSTNTTTELSLTNAPQAGFQSDAIVFNAKLLVSGQTSVNSYARLTGFWDSPADITGLSSAYPHPLCAFENLNYVTVANGNVVTMYDTSFNLIATLTIPMGYVVTSMRWRENTLYIATRNIAGGSAILFTWAGTFDGSGNGTGAQGYGVEADWIYSCCEYQNNIAVVTSEGQILSFSGGGFDFIAAFPVYYTPYDWISSNAILNIIGNVANRGMVGIGDNLFININGATSVGPGQFPGQNLVNQPSGLWEFKPGVGLFHKAGFPYATHQKVTVSQITSSFLNLSAAVDVKLGDAVVFLSTSITGLNSGQTYFAMPADSIHIRLALSPADAINGIYIFISGTTGDTMHIDSYSSVGATVISNPGPVHPIRTILPNIFFGSEVLFGGTVLDSTNTVRGMFMSLGMGRNVGSFTMARVASQSLTDMWKKMFMKLEPYFRSADSVLIKYKTEKRLGMPLTQTSGMVQWTSSTTFTVDRTKREFSSALNGDEIEVIQGAGSGFSAHITNIDKGTDPLWNVTVSPAIPGAVNGAFFDFITDNFTLLATKSYTDKSISEGFFEEPIGGDDGESKWIQLKVLVSGYDIEMDQLDVISTGNMNFE